MNQSAGPVFRSPADRQRHIYRKANPWYRRVARAVIATGLLCVLGVGLYFGALTVQDWMNRDRLPAVGVESAGFQSTTFTVHSRTDDMVVDGSLSLDLDSNAFEFVGRPGGQQDGLHVVSPDGVEVFVRDGSGAWSTEDSQGDGDRIRRAIAFLGIRDADDVLTDRLRKSFVELAGTEVRTIEPNDASDRSRKITRYDLVIDTAGFADEHPVQFSAWKDSVRPDGATSPAGEFTIWIDDEDVVVGLDDSVTGWAWDRVRYSTEDFVPPDPRDDATTG